MNIFEKKPVFLVGTFFFTGCGLGTGVHFSNSNTLNSQNTAQQPLLESPVPWLVVYYGMGDNDLSQDVRQDIAEMETVGSTSSVLVVGQVDFSAKRSPDSDSRFIVKAAPGSDFGELSKQMGFSTQVAKFREIDSGNPDVLKDFLRWAIQKFPADHRALVLSGHGYGFSTRVRNEKIPIGGAVSADRFATSRSGTRYFSHDEFPAEGFEGKSSLTTLELTNALAQINSEFSFQNSQASNAFEVVVADSCVSQTIENAYALRNVTNYYVASQETERASGHDWGRTLYALNEASRVWDPFKRSSLPFDAGRFASAVVDGYVAQNLPNTQLSVVDVTKLEPVVQGLRKFAEEAFAKSDLVEKWMSERKPYFGGLLAPKIWVDIYTMIYDLSIAGVVSPSTKAQISDGLKKAVVENRARGPGSVGMAHGLSLTLPGKAVASNSSGSRVSENFEIEVELGIGESEVIQGPIFSLLSKIYCKPQTPCGSP